MSKNPTFYDTMVSSPQWKLWYEEMMRRFIENYKLNEQKNRTFDIDESQECGWLGEDHFQEFLKFVSAQAVQEALDIELKKALAKQKAELVEKIEELKKSSQITRVGGAFNGDTPVIIKDRDYHEKMNVIYATIDEVIDLIKEEKDV